MINYFLQHIYRPAIPVEDCFLDSGNLRHLQTIAPGPAAVNDDRQIEFVRQRQLSSENLPLFFFFGFVFLNPFIPIIQTRLADRGRFLNVFADESKTFLNLRRIDIPRMNA